MEQTILANHRFGRLVVLAFVERKSGEDFYRCRCDCGNEKIVRGSNLKHGSTRSCGCISRELMRELGKAARTNGQQVGRESKWSELSEQAKIELARAKAAKGRKKTRGSWRTHNEKIKAERTKMKKAKRKLYRTDLPWLK